MTNTHLGWQFLGIPPESFRAHCGGSNGIKIVGDQNDLLELKNWNAQHKQARLITAEAAVEAAKDRNNLAEIPDLVTSTMAIYTAARDALGLPDVWWEIPPIMPPANEWIAQWNAAMIVAMKKAGMRSVAFGFPLGYPQVKPFATVDNPDQWPILYPTLKAIHEAGTQWSRLGLQEYITGGVGFDINNKTSTLRCDYVVQYHIQPNGWIIDIAIIETSWDVPAMLDIKGMSPTKCWDGMKALDAEYAKRPWLAVAYIYAVLDPNGSYGPNEGSFAYTPGNKNTPMGYLETGEAYFAENKPAPFVYRTSGVTLPPVVNPPISPTTQLVDMVTVNGAVLAAENGICLNVRSGPSTNYPIIFEALPNEQLQAISITNGWVKLKPRSTFKNVYVSAKYVIAE